MAGELVPPYTRARARRPPDTGKAHNDDQRVRDQCGDGGQRLPVTQRAKLPGLERRPPSTAIQASRKCGFNAKPRAPTMPVTMASSVETDPLTARRAASST